MTEYGDALQWLWASTFFAVGVICGAYLRGWWLRRQADGWRREIRALARKARAREAVPRRKTVGGAPLGAPGKPGGW